MALKLKGAPKGAPGGKGLKKVLCAAKFRSFPRAKIKMKKRAMRDQNPGSIAATEYTFGDVLYELAPSRQGNSLYQIAVAR